MKPLLDEVSSLVSRAEAPVPRRLLPVGFARGALDVTGVADR